MTVNEEFGPPELPERWARPLSRRRRREPGAVVATLLIIIVLITGWISAASQLLPTTTAAPLPRRPALALAGLTPTVAPSFPETADVSEPPTEPSVEVVATPTPSVAVRPSLPSALPLAPAIAIAAPTVGAPTVGVTNGASSSTSSGTVHVVASGDTLFGIARQYQVSPDALAAANGFPDPSSLRVGQQLTIPAQAGSSASSSSSAPFPTATVRPLPG